MKSLSSKIHQFLQQIYCNMKSVIVGAGVGGTALAARLAKQGHEVKVYEKNGFLGGRCSLIHHNGHRFDQGPSLLLMLEIFEQTFADLGTDIHEELVLLKCDPNYKIHFHDGRVIELSSNLADLLREIKKFEIGDCVEDNTIGFLRETGIHYEKSVTHALGNNFSSWLDLIRLRYISLPFTLHIWDSVWGRVSKYFKSEYLRRAFTFQTLYVGMSPYDAPALYNLLQYTEIAGGIWYPKGGFTEVARVLEGIAKNNGAKFYYNAEVTQIKVNDLQEVTGVIVDGVAEEADIVVCNADLVYAYNKLLPQTKYGKSLGINAKLTYSSISFYWSLSTVVEQLSTHNMFLAGNYKGSFDDILDNHTLPTEPSFYVNVPSRIDPTAAPPGKDTVAVLVPVGHIVEDEMQNFDELVTRARKMVLARLQRKFRIDFRQLIIHEIVNDPRTWQEKFNLWQGSILGLSHNLTQVISFRPKTRSEQFKRLYFVGASSQPGTGVPLVLCSAKLVVDQIETDLRNRSAANRICFSNARLVLVFLLILFFSALIIKS